MQIQAKQKERQKSHSPQGGRFAPKGTSAKPGVTAEGTSALEMEKAEAKAEPTLLGIYLLISN